MLGDPGPIEALAQRARATSSGYLEVLRVPAMSVGVYVLGKGAEDRQSPHREAEVYYVTKGRGRFRAGRSERAVGPGDVLFVGATTPHRFVAIDEELVLLVVFAPAESGA